MLPATDALWRSSVANPLLLVACLPVGCYTASPSRRPTLPCSLGSLVAQWDASWPWARQQLVAACHGPGDTLLLLTAARTLYLISHGGGGSHSSMALGHHQQQQQQPAAQCLLERFSLKVSCCTYNALRTVAANAKAADAAMSANGMHAGVYMFASGRHTTP
jgi:hypothetical protein